MTSKGDIQEVIETLETANLRNFAYTVALVLTVHDFLVTFSDEVIYIWRPKKNLVFFLFICLRYGNLSYEALSAFKVATSVWTSAECIGLTYAHRSLQILIAGSMSATFILRCYAVWNRRKVVLVLLGLIFIMKMIALLISLYHSFSPTIIAGPLGSQMICTLVGRPNAAILETLNSSIVIAFDSLVLFLTMARTFCQAKRSCANSRKSLDLPKGLDYFLLRDGLLYYAAVDALVLASIVLNQFPSQAALAQVVEALQPALSSVITQRLILNLHTVSTANRVYERFSGVLTSFEFAHGTVIGNVGAPLRDSTEDLIDVPAE